MEQVYLVGGYRTPIGKTGGILKNFLPEQLAAAVLNGTIEKFQLLPSAIEQVLLGNAVGPGGNIARVSLLKAGWPFHIPAMTIDLQCGSGLAAINMAADQIRARQADLILAGGVESTSMAPRRQFNSNDPRFQGVDKFYERAPFSPSEIGDPEMGQGAEEVARLQGISREKMDNWALTSHKRAIAAKKEGLLTDIIFPLTEKEKTIAQDEGIRLNMSARLLQRLPSAFVEDGVITAGNACLTHDGAAVILLASAHALKKYNLKPVARILGNVVVGFDPRIFPLSPVVTIKKLLTRTGVKMEEVDGVEINEAFAVKVLACCDQLGLDLERTNILGGALAYGHPYGASGAIILLHLLKALQKVEGRLGIASLGVAGGQGVATLIERCN